MGLCATRVVQMRPFCRCFNWRLIGVPRCTAENHPGIDVAIDLCRASLCRIGCRRVAKIEAASMSADPATAFPTACLRET
jgi:hypothetical protein